MQILVFIYHFQSFSGGMVDSRPRDGKIQEDSGASCGSSKLGIPPKRTGACQKDTGNNMKELLMTKVGTI